MMSAMTKNDEPGIAAFKEWQIVCAALGSGEQTLILRKGGIAEGREGFRWLHDRFFLFPTHFHQQTEGVREQRTVSPPDADHRLAIDLWAEIVVSARLSDWSQVEALAAHHIWTPEVVRERFEWGDEPGLSVALLRVRRMRKPWILRDADRSAFGGCRSWLNLPLAEWREDSPDEEDIETSIAAADPVISDQEFAQQRDEIGSLLGA